MIATAVMGGFDPPPGPPPGMGPPTGATGPPAGIGMPSNMSAASNTSQPMPGIPLAVQQKTLQQAAFVTRVCYLPLTKPLTAG